MSSQESRPTPAQKKALDVQEDRLKRKPEIEYTFSDWESRALSAYAAKQFDVAANFFLEASKSPDAAQNQVAHALFVRAVMLGQLNRTEEAIGVYEEVITRYGAAIELAVQVQVVMATFNKGVLLGRLNRHEEAIAIYEQIIKRYGQATEPALRIHVAKAMVNKGSTLGRFNRRDEAVAIFEQIIKRFGEAAEPALRESVAAAINGIGFNTLLKAKKAWQEGGTRAQLLSDAESKFRNALDQYPQSAVANGNLGYALFLSGQQENVMDPLRRALELGGEQLYKLTIKDTETYTVPEDAAFRELLEKTWKEIQSTKNL